MTDEKTHFGFQSVPLDDKQRKVNEVFHSVAGRYDLMNDLMSAGLTPVEGRLVTALRPPRDRPFRHLDVAGGTGDVAFRILDAGGPQTHVTVLDINGEMLKVGRERAARAAMPAGSISSRPTRRSCLPSRKPTTPIRSRSASATCPASSRLARSHRVLKPGGRFLCLEFSKVDVPLLDKIYDAYSFNVIPQARPDGDRGCANPTNISSNPSAASPACRFRADDRGGGIQARDPPAADRRHRQHSFRLEDLT